MENKKLELARQLVERTGHSLFLTGKAGTGKTTFLRELRASSRKRMIVTAPTGIAAINAGGVTLHSFFQLDFGPYVPGAYRPNRRAFSFGKDKIRIIRGLDLLVIDEISMVRSDMLDAVDDVLRRYRDHTLPFGGVQLLMIGDLQQLPPVVVESERAILQAHYRSPYFFDSHALANLDYATLELDHVYRQTDGQFLDILNAVRNNRADADVLAKLNARCVPGFNPSDSEGYVRLTTHNRMADEINWGRLQALPAEPCQFAARVEGNFPQSSYPAELNLTLKVGAQVMFIKNDTAGQGRRYYNGMLGTVTGIDDSGVVVTPADGGMPVSVEPVVWENMKYEVDEQTHEVRETREGAFTQLPLRTAWAITIHKSQGLTFDRAIIDASMSFTHGQTYVALSRCRTLGGLVLERPIQPGAIITDPTVTGFMQTHTADIDEASINSMSHTYALRMAAGMFNFRPIFSALEGMVRLYQENFMRLFPSQVQRFASFVNEMRSTLVPVGDKFAVQIGQLDAEAGGADHNPKLAGRLKDASKYFLKQLDLIAGTVDTMPDEHDNANVNKKLRERRDLFMSFSTIRHHLLSHFVEHDFDINAYLDIKAEGAFTETEKKPKRVRTHVSVRTQDNLHPVLMDRLIQWRADVAAGSGINPNVIIGSKSLIAISNHLPISCQELFMMPGVGKSFVANHGDEVLDLIDEFMSSNNDLVMIPLPQRKGKKDKRHIHTLEKDTVSNDAVAGVLSAADTGDDKPVKLEKPTKPARPKVKAGDSARISYTMFCEGKSVAEIATERGLKESTIDGHIFETIDKNDKELLDRFIPEDMQRGIEAYFDATPELPAAWPELFEGIRKACGAEPRFAQLKLMLSICGRLVSKPRIDADAATPQTAGEPEPFYGAQAGVNELPDFLN